MITPIVGNKYYQVYTNPVRLVMEQNIENLRNQKSSQKTEEQEKGKF